MKSLILAIIFSSLIGEKSEAQNIPNGISQAFYNSFPQAGKATWSTTGKLYKAEFNAAGEKQFAFFNQSGELVAESRYIDFTNLSHSLRLALIKQFPNYNIAEIFEVYSDLQTDYYVTLERNGIKFIVKSSGKGKWKVFQDNK